jgi:hypothetical protein
MFQGFEGMHPNRVALDVIRRFENSEARNPQVLGCFDGDLVVHRWKSRFPSAPLRAGSRARKKALEMTKSK